MAELFTKDHRDYFLRELEDRKVRRPYYSKRAFARDLGISPSTVTGFLKGEIRFTYPRVLSIGKKLKLSSDQIEHWLDLMEKKFSRYENKSKEAEIKILNRIAAAENFISLDKFRFISLWQHAAYLELLNLDARKYSNAKTVANILNVSPKFVNQMNRRLVTLKMIKKNARGEYSVERNIRAGDTAPSAAIREFHAGILNQAIRSLETQSVGERSNSAIVFRIPKTKIPIIQEEIKVAGWNIVRKFFDKDDSQNDSLYCLSINFFNLIK